MKKWFALLGVILIIIIGVFIGVKLAGVLGGRALLFGGNKYREKKKEEAFENIHEAGEDIEATEHDSDSALDMYDNFFSDNGER